MRTYEFARVDVEDLVATDWSDVGSADWHQAEPAETIDEADGVVFAAPKVD